MNEKFVLGILSLALNSVSCFPNRGKPFKQNRATILIQTRFGNEEPDTIQRMTCFMFLFQTTHNGRNEGKKYPLNNKTEKVNNRRRHNTSKQLVVIQNRNVNEVKDEKEEVLIIISIPPH